MNDPLRSPKLRPWHLDRSAVVYVRQSTPQQVDRPPGVHRPPVRPGRPGRRPGLAPRARHWSSTTTWARAASRSRAGPGSSGSWPRWRLDHVGLILGLEMSRLARSCRDWHQLLELCARFRTLLADADGLYDPTDHNDRLLLGLHGMMSEAELHILKERMYQGKLNKARRGELLGVPRSATSGSPRGSGRSTRTSRSR